LTAALVSDIAAAFRVPIGAVSVTALRVGSLHVNFTVTTGVAMTAVSEAATALSTPSAWPATRALHSSIAADPSTFGVSAVTVLGAASQAPADAATSTGGNFVPIIAAVCGTAVVLVIVVAIVAVVLKKRREADAASSSMADATRPCLMAHEEELMMRQRQHKAVEVSAVHGDADLEL
jgi:hypothetical protein